MRNPFHPVAGIKEYNMYVGFMVVISFVKMHIIGTFNSQTYSGHSNILDVMKYCWIIKVTNT